MPLTLQTRSVAKEIAARHFPKALSLRGTEFQEMLTAFHDTSAFPDESTRLPNQMRMRVGLIQ